MLDQVAHRDQRPRALVARIGRDVQDQPFDEILRAFIPVRVFCAGDRDDEGIGDQAGVFDDGLVVEREHRERVIRLAVGVSRSAAWLKGSRTITFWPSAARRSAVMLASSAFGSIASTLPR